MEQTISYYQFLCCNHYRVFKCISLYSYKEDTHDELLHDQKLSKTDTQTEDLFPDDFVAIPLEDFIQNYILNMYPKAFKHIKKITIEVIKLIGDLETQEKRSKKNNISKRRKSITTGKIERVDY